MKYVSVAEMVSIEKEADSLGHTYPKMMELAGKGLAQIINDEFQNHDSKCVIGFVGSGNNGGDTLVALSYLQSWGWQTAAYLVKGRNEDDPLVLRAVDLGCEVIDHSDDQDYLFLNNVLETHKILIDGILGTGIRLPLRGVVRDVISEIGQKIKLKRKSFKIIAVDCPSGVDCDSGETAPEAIAADFTITMAAVKQGLLKFPAYNLIGDLKCIGIGLPLGLSSIEKVNRTVVSRELVQKLLPDRPLDAHKGTFGRVMVVAGSKRYCGAAVLAGEAAFRSGAGWVTLAVPETLHSSLAGVFLEATWLPLPHKDGWISELAYPVVLENINRASALVVGPGIGVEPMTYRFLENLLEEGREILPALVIDADGLKIISSLGNWQEWIPNNAVLTPHPGEMAIMTGERAAEINRNRVEMAETFAKKWSHVVVLKGAFTVIAAPNGNTAIIPIATPALARAGTGDVLAGLIGGFLAQGLDAFDAAVAGAWVHAQAGLQALSEFGNSASILAGDVLDSIRGVMTKLNSDRL